MEIRTIIAATCAALAFDGRSDFTAGPATGSPLRPPPRCRSVPDCMIGAMCPLRIAGNSDSTGGFVMLAEADFRGRTMSGSRHRGRWHAKFSACDFNNLPRS